MPRTRYRASWLTALLYALAIDLSAVAIFGYWFAMADRYQVFLYYHDMGSLAADTSPFGRVTASRYWMSALVWAGAVMAFYVAVNWLAGLISPRYQPPAWWQVWAVCVGPLVVAVPLITMTSNQPTLPVSHALQVTLATLVGLALALTPGRMAADRPMTLLLLAGDGMGLMLILTASLGLERIGRLSADNHGFFIAIAVISVLGGLILLFALSALRLWRGWLMPEWRELLVAGLCVAYLLMPLIHHVGFTNGYYYISDADNFFTRRVTSQLAIWLSLILLAMGVSWLRKQLQARLLKGAVNT